MTGKVLTANRVGDGVVVFWSRDDQWAEAINEALVTRTEVEVATLEALAEKSRAGTDVTDVYLFDAMRDGNTVHPDHIRERIRALGPTVRGDLGKQAIGIGGAFGAVV
jgi:hypothetical protein